MYRPYLVVSGKVYVMSPLRKELLEGLIKLYPEARLEDLIELVNDPRFMDYILNL